MGLVVGAEFSTPLPQPIATDLQPNPDNRDKSASHQFVRAPLSLRRISWDSHVEP